MAGIPQQLQQVSFTDGIDSSESEYLSLHPKLSDIKNGVFTNNGSIGKRFGYTKTPLDPAGEAPIRLINDADKEMLMVTSTGTLSSYSPTGASSYKFTSKGSLPIMVAYRDPITGAAGRVQQSDCMILGNYLFILYITYNQGETISASSGAFLSVIDLTNNAPVISGQSLQSTYTGLYWSPRIVKISSTKLALCYRLRNSTARFHIVDISTAVSVGTSTTVTFPADCDLVDAEGELTIDGSSTPGFAMVGYRSATGNCYIKTINATGTTTTTTTVAITTGSTALGLCGDKGHKLWVFTEQLGFLRGFLFDTNTQTVSVANADRGLQLTLGGGASGGGTYLNTIGACLLSPGVNADVVVVCSTDSVDNQHAFNTTATQTCTAMLKVFADGTFGSQHSMPCVPLSKPFKYGSSYYLQGIEAPHLMTVRAGEGYMDSLQRTCIIYSIDPTSSNYSSTPVALTAVRQAYHDGYVDPVVSGIYSNHVSGVAVSTYKCYSTVTSCGAVPTETTTTISLPPTVTELLTLDFDYQFNYSAASLGESTLIAAGIPLGYDGTNAHEWAPIMYPEVIKTTVSAAGALNNGTYKYRVFYNIQDARGQFARSYYGEATATTDSGGAGNTVTLQFPRPHTTAMRTLAFTSPTKVLAPDVQVVIYRTQLGADTAYELARITRNAGQSGNNTYTDASNDAAQLSGKPFAYTTAEIGEFIPPSILWCCTHKNRLWALGDDRKTLWFTKQKTYGIRPGFSDQNQVVINDDGKPLTAMVSQDDFLVVFKQDAIYLVHGEGPTAAGVSFDYTVEKLPTDVGCINPNSIFSNHLGVFFQSRKGLSFLSRSRQVEWIGQGVQTYLETYPVITSVAHEPSQNHIRWTLMDSRTSPTLGIELVFDYLYNRWTTFSIAGTGHPMSGSVYYQGSYYCVDATTATGALWKETTSSYNDDTSWVNLDVTTHWFKHAGPQGYFNVGKIGFLGQYYTPHGFNVSLWKDYEGMAYHTASWADSLATAQTIGEQFQLNPNTQKIEALKIRIVDSQPTGFSSLTNTGRSCSFNSILQSVEILPGEYRLDQSYIL